MKRFTKFFTVTLSVIFILGMVAVSADNTAEDSETLKLVQVYLSIEGPDGLYALADGIFMGDGTTSVGDVVTNLTSEDYLDMEVLGVSDGYVSSVNGIASGIFGGWDGWLYVVKNVLLDENGEMLYYTDIPSVGMNDYKIETACQIIVYYGDYDDALAGYYTTDDGMIKLVSYAPVYDENYNLVSFDESPLAGGSFDFTPIIVDDKTGETTLGQTISFIADENGLTKLDTEFRAVANGVYYGSIGKQSDETATIGEETITKPEVARYSFIYEIDNKPLEKDIFINQVFLLLTGMNRNSNIG